MNKKDLVFIVILSLFFLPFFISKELYALYLNLNSEHGFIAAFFKFAILATAGELIGLRIRSGSYLAKGFGIIPRMVVWGVLGLAIKAAFVIFPAGVPSVLKYLGMNNAEGVLTSVFSPSKLLVAFFISLFLNMFFSPVLMTLHKVTDAHIVSYNGSILSIVRPVRIGYILKEMDWNTHWNFVLKKTIPFFWIPAHTLTFLLPAEFQILFAAILGIVLGVILAFASLAGTDK
jgi:hypothetical protein